MMGRAFMPLPGGLISMVEGKVQPFVDSMSQQGEKVRLYSPYALRISVLRSSAD